MSTVEAAQKWAEANGALAKARESLKAAEEAFATADAADKEAWLVLQELSGRVAGKADFVATSLALTGGSTSRARMNGGVIERAAVTLPAGRFTDGPVTVVLEP